MSRRVVLPVALWCLLQVLLFSTARGDVPATKPSSVEQWDIFELALPGPASPVQTGGNPFDVMLSAKFTLGEETISANGFYDGDGVYRVRFMPSEQGVWKFETTSDVPELAGQRGEFTCAKPTGGNHGPIAVKNMYSFAYADGTRFVPISTTIYGWVNQRSDALQEETLASLKASPFNRVRMAVLPITYGNDNVPLYFPFADKGKKNWDFDHLDPRFFQHIEKRLADLRDMDIQAELILFHGRDGGLTKFDRMPASADDRYIRYCVARFSAFRNISWNLANEFDAMGAKTDADWDRFFQIIQAEDPYQHPRAIHQMHRYYDPTKPWVTYMSVQSEMAVTGFGRPEIYRRLARKPVVFDEVQYEGDIPQGWGHLTGEQMTERFWMGIVAGTFVTHGETFASEPGVRWISRGGKLVGESPKRIAFLKEIINAAPDGLSPIEPGDDKQGILGRQGEYYLIYLGHEKRDDWTFELPGGRIRPGTTFHVDVIDTWNMTTTPIQTPVKIGTPTTPSRWPADPALKIPLGGKPYMAIRIQRLSSPTTAPAR